MASVGLKEHLRFCQIDGWTELKSARGAGRDHIYFIKELADGRTLRTKVSHGSKHSEYRGGLWKQIWHDQLELASEAEFWAVLRERRPARRQQQAGVSPGQEEMPAWLVQRLIYSVGLREDEIVALSRAEAERRWQDYQMLPSLSPLAESEVVEGKPTLESLHLLPARAVAGVAAEQRIVAGY